MSQGSDSKTPFEFAGPAGPLWIDALQQAVAEENEELENAPPSPTFLVPPPPPAMFAVPPRPPELRKIAMPRTKTSKAAALASTSTAQPAASSTESTTPSGSKIVDPRDKKIQSLMQQKVKMAQEANTEIAELKKENEDLQRQLGSIQDICKSVKEISEFHAKDAQEFQEKLEEVQTKLQEEQKAHRKCREKIKNLESDVANSAQLVKELGTEIEGLKDELGNKDREIQGHLKAVTTLTAERDNGKEKHDTLYKTFQDNVELRKQVEDENLTLRIQLNVAHNDKDDEIEELKNQLGCAMADLEAFKEDHAQRARDDIEYPIDPKLLRKSGSKSGGRSGSKSGSKKKTKRQSIAQILENTSETDSSEKTSNGNSQNNDADKVEDIANSPTVSQRAASPPTTPKQDSPSNTTGMAQQGSPLSPKLLPNPSAKPEETTDIAVEAEVNRPDQQIPSTPTGTPETGSHLVDPLVLSSTPQISVPSPQTSRNSAETSPERRTVSQGTGGENTFLSSAPTTPTEKDEEPNGNDTVMEGQQSGSSANIPEIGGEAGSLGQADDASPPGDNNNTGDLLLGSPKPPTPTSGDNRTPSDNTSQTRIESPPVADTPQIEDSNTLADSGTPQPGNDDVTISGTAFETELGNTFTSNDQSGNSTGSAIDEAAGQVSGNENSGDTIGSPQDNTVQRQGVQPDHVCYQGGFHNPFDCWILVDKLVLLLVLAYFWELLGYSKEEASVRYRAALAASNTHSESRKRRATTAVDIHTPALNNNSQAPIPAASAIAEGNTDTTTVNTSASAYDLDAAQAQDPETPRMKVVLAFCAHLVVYYSILHGISASQERNLWLAANGATRAYFFQYHNPISNSPVASPFANALFGPAGIVPAFFRYVGHAHPGMAFERRIFGDVVHGLPG
ncbi:hypothetical protein PVAG01_09101 [Phlyctema vagabunda]|uniref:Uncharacterized protein n=1 Tax=Phlyctema vagabunda TaxID=108571 RepID=A0ABR4P6F1_9HELO